MRGIRNVLVKNPEAFLRVPGCGRSVMRARRAVATLRMWTEGALGPQAAAVPPVVRAGRAAQNSPERKGPATGRPVKRPGGQVGASGLRGY